jgi:hypothetical protein
MRTAPHGDIDHTEVVRAVRTRFEHATVERWQVHHLGRGRGDNATSLGVQRVHGSARTPERELAFSHIRKVFVRPPGGAAEEAQDHWNHWRREPLLMASGRLAELPIGVAAPRVDLIVDEGERATVWMEDAGDEPHDGWSRRRLAMVAYRLGTVAGRFLDHDLAEPWLSRDLLGQWITDLPLYAPLLHDSDAAGWSDERVRRIHGGRGGNVASLLDHAASIWAGVAQTPSTLCHRDCSLENLRLRDDGSGLVLFDWALAGPGPVGEDLGLLLASAAPLVTGDPLALGRQLLVAYLRGVAATAPDQPVEATTVWRTTVTTAALREAIYSAARLSQELASGAPDTDLLGRLAAGAPALEVLAGEALRLAAPHAGRTRTSSLGSVSHHRA